METVFIILTIVAALVALFMITALFVPKAYSIEREVIIDRSVREVFNYIRYLRNQEHFSKWVMTDPGMKKQFKGTDGAPGFVYAWDSQNKNAGKGEQEIKQIVEGERIDVEVRFEKPFEGVAQTPFVTTPVSANQTKLLWGMRGQSKYPLNVMNLFMGKMLSRDLEISLGNLKTILEK